MQKDIAMTDFGAGWLTRLSLIAICLCTTTNTTLAYVMFDWAVVGQPGNEPDRLYSSNNPNNLRFGAVNYTYRIGKYEVTNSQYADFLNAVDATGTNPSELFNSRMGTEPDGGIEFSPAAPNGSKYVVKANFANKPINYVSFFDSMRFVNWLENGQPTSGSGTENGVYTIGTGISETRTLGARFFIPSEDEWYKAAYHDPRATTQGGPPGDDHYWFYPTSSDDAPIPALANSVGDIANPGTNVANYMARAAWNGAPYNVTTVGSAGANSASFYGTFDQGGNVMEFNEAISGSNRCFRGGETSAGASVLGPNYRQTCYPPDSSSGSRGLRVASIFNPSAADFNGDGQLDCVDVDRLVSEIAAGSNGANFDLTGDNLVDAFDLSEWLGLAGSVNLPSGNAYLIGDANLDGLVDGLDYIAWNSHKFTATAAWCSGDFNADGFVDVADFNQWNGNKFTSSDGMSAVPEPGMGVLLISVIIGSAIVRRR